MNSLELAKKRAEIEKSKAKRSKLDEHIKAIEYLLFEESFTLKQIQNFLEEDCNCKVAYSSLHAFCKRRFKNIDTNLEKVAYAGTIRTASRFTSGHFAEV
ncbi:hypothetical protein, partial [Aliarcobacter butzleri]